MPLRPSHVQVVRVPPTACHFVLVGFFMCLGCSGTCPAPSRPTTAPQANATPEAEKIVEAMRQRYRTAKSYEDRGTYRGVIRSKDRPDMITTARFRTVWDGGTRFGF